MAISTSTYIAKGSPVHACSAGVKILLLLAYSIGIFFVGSWWGIAAYGALCLAVAAASKISPAVFAKTLIPVYVMMLFPILFNGIDPGLLYALRILFLALASFIVCFSTTPTALTQALTTGLGPLRALKVPVEDIATTLSLALRFIPLLAVEVRQLHDAHLSRGAYLDDGSLLQRLKAWSAVFVPLFVGLFRKADRLSQAMDARCYGMPGVARTSLQNDRISAVHIGVLALGLVVLMVIAILG